MYYPRSHNHRSPLTIQSIDHNKSYVMMNNRELVNIYHGMLDSNGCVNVESNPGLHLDILDIVRQINGLRSASDDHLTRSNGYDRVITPLNTIPGDGKVVMHTRFMVLHVGSSFYVRAVMYLLPEHSQRLRAVM